MHARRAMTLIELLAAIAILATLIGILLPSLGAARASAHDVSCAAMQDQLFLHTAAWAIDNRDKLPGINTTGLRAQSDYDAQQDMLFDTRADSPTSTFDWMSPVLGTTAELSPNRAERTRQLFTDFSCPSTQLHNETLWGYTPDIADFTDELNSPGYPQISYLSPAAFHLFGPRQGAVIQGRHYGWLGPAITPAGYRPFIDQVGTQPSQKIFLADGTRYVGATGKLDFDISVNPAFFGSFTSSGPIYIASTAYGRSRHLASAAERGGRPPLTADAPQHNRDLSYRHRGRIGTLRYDGSFVWMSEDESKTDAVPWYPSGSRFTGFRATPEAADRHEVDSILW